MTASCKKPVQDPEALNLLARLEAHARLGHAKRNEALIRQVRLALSAPGVPLPQAAGQGAVSPSTDLMSLYRFAQNPKVSLARLRAIRRALVLSRFPKGADIVVVHDPTLLDYTRHNSKEDRRPIGDHRGRGYEYIPVAAVDPVEGRFVGLLHDTVVNDEGPDDVGEMDYDYEPLFADFDEEETKRLRENHRHQMAVHVRGLEAPLRDYHPIHVADREFDDLFVFQASPGTDLVVRATDLRNVQVPERPWVSQAARTRKQGGHPLREGWTCVNLERLVEDIPTTPYKSLALDREGRLAQPGTTVRRQAALSIGSCPVCLYRQAKRNGCYYPTPRPVDLNLVIVREKDPPPGEKALLWVLLTTLPAETGKESARVAGLYELRWLIEVFIRLLKSGYRIEDARLNNAHKTGVLLLILSIAATTLLDLKAALGLGPGGRLDDETYKRLKQAWKTPEAPTLTPQWRLLGLIARYGGWLGRRGDPLGPNVLMRGLLLVLAALHMVEQLGSLVDEIRNAPETLGGIFRV